MNARYTFALALAMAGLLALQPAHAAQQAAKKEPPAAKKATAKADRAGANPARVAARFVPTAWQVKCVAAGGGKDKVACVLTRSIIEARTRQVLLLLEIPDSREFLTLQLPHGLDLRFPAQVLVDGKMLGKAPFITSRPAGAYARMKLGEKALSRLSKGKRLSVKMKVFNGRDMTVRMDLKGFTAALGKLR